MNAVSALTATTRGRWLVSTRHTQHVWDLDAMTVRRLPGPESGVFPDDGQPLILNRVDRWPVVGGTFFVWLEPAEGSDLIEFWRQSSPVRSIERLPTESQQPHLAEAAEVREDVRVRCVRTDCPLIPPHPESFCRSLGDEYGC